LRMAQMNFLELLENMVPEALTHGKDILGGGAAGTPAVLRSGAPAATPVSAPAAAAPLSPPPRIPRIVKAS
jgi:hypothetical protein